MGASENKSSGFDPLVWLVITVLVGFLAYILLAPSHYHDTGTLSATITCINNLRDINAAKNEWALENGKTNGVVVVANQLTNYLHHGIMPKCPSGGVYTIGKVGELPTCSLGTNVNPPHVLP